MSGHESGISACLFGRQPGGPLLHFPDDGLRALTDGLADRCKAATQLVIVRDGAAMHYAYVRKFGPKGVHVGMCLTLGGHYLSCHVDWLFHHFFEKAVERLAEEGLLVCYAPDGSGLLAEGTPPEQDAARAADFLHDLARRFVGDPELLTPLPPEDLAEARDTERELSYDVTADELAAASVRGGTTFVYKADDYDTLHVKSYAGTLRQLSEQNRQLEARCAELQKENKRAGTRKRPVGWMIFLLVALVAMGGYVYYLIMNYYSPSDISYIVSHELNSALPAQGWGGKNLAVDAQGVTLYYYSRSTQTVIVELRYVCVRSGKSRSVARSFLAKEGENSIRLEFEDILNLNQSYWVMVVTEDGMVVAGRRWGGGVY